MVIHPLQYIPGMLAVKKTGRQFHQLNKKVCKDGDINTGTDMQQYPASYKFYCQPSGKQGKLRQQNNIYKMDIGSIHSCIYNALSKKRKKKLQKTGNTQADK